MWPIDGIKRQNEVAGQGTIIRVDTAPEAADEAAGTVDGGAEDALIWDNAEVVLGFLQAMVSAGFAENMPARLVRMFGIPGDLSVLRKHSLEA